MWPGRASAKDGIYVDFLPSSHQGKFGLSLQQVVNREQSGILI
jgi:hypothetical protein